ncbi:hypothetical protein NX059_007351 [Plenodomus lindquistii]|nr:hypothetical protein NX059_007351 [Plenodomus lindquistii]
MVGTNSNLTSAPTPASESLILTPFLNNTSSPNTAPSPETAGSSSDTSTSHLSLMTCTVAGLRHERDRWRSHVKNISAHAFAQTRMLSAAEEEIINLRKEKTETECTHQALQARFDDLMDKHMHVTEQLQNVKRMFVVLRRSDRKKGHFEKSHLRLKSAFKRFMMGNGCAGGEKTDAGVEVHLREALALATSRIEELEKRGEAVLDVLEKLNESEEEDVDEEGNCEMGTKPTLVEVEVAFRGVLDDGAFAEERQRWKGFLEE